jgi:hypothetical protein
MEIIDTRIEDFDHQSWASIVHAFHLLAIESHRLIRRGTHGRTTIDEEGS